MRKNTLILILMILPNLAFGVESLVFGTNNGDIVANFSSSVLKSAYQKMKIEISIKEAPPKRALMNANLGKVDGELHRIEGLQKKFSDLREVSVPVVQLEWVLFSKKHKFVVQGVDSLKPYSVSTRRGIVFAEKMVEVAKRHHLVNDWKQALLTVNGGRIDLALLPRILGLVALKETPMDVYSLEPPIKTIYLYHYLHKKHESLVPQVTKVLEEMRDSGEIKRIWDQVEQTL